MENQKRFEIVKVYEVCPIEILEDVLPEEEVQVIKARDSIESLQQSVDILRLNINRKMAKIKKFNNKKVEENKSTIDVIHRTAEQIREVEAEIEKIFWSKVETPKASDSKANSEEEELGEGDYQEQWREKFNQAFESRKSKLSKKDDAEIKKLYRWICSRTHPDKTKDPAKHELFLKAKEYREAGDIKGLRDIVHMLKTGRSRLLDSLLKRMQELVIEREMLSERDKDLENHEDFIAADAFIHNPIKVMEIIRDSYLKKSRELAIELSTKMAYLRELKGESPHKKTHGFTTFNFE